MANLFWKTIPVLTLALSVSAQAPQESPRSELAVKDKSTMMKAKSMPCGVVETNECCARGCSQNMGGGIEFDVLYWRSGNRGYNSAWNVNDPFTTGSGAPPPNFGTTGPNPLAAKLIRVHEEFQPGFRIGFGYNSPYDRFEYMFVWTWYRNHATTDASRAELGVTNDDGQGFYPVKDGLVNAPASNIVGPYRSVHSSLKLWYNCFDLDMSRSYYLTKHFSMRSTLGVRSAILKQKFRSRFEDPEAATSLGGVGVNVLNFEAVRVDEKFYGFGPRMGSWMEFHIGRGFSVVGKGSVSALFGQQKVHANTLGYNGSSLPAAQGKDYFKFTNMQQTLVPNLQLFLGLQWAGCFSCDEIYFGANAGWETNYYWAQAALSTFSSNQSTDQPITLEGLTVDFHLDY